MAWAKDGSWASRRETVPVGPKFGRAADPSQSLLCGRRRRLLDSQSEGEESLRWGNHDLVAQVNQERSGLMRKFEYIFRVLTCEQSAQLRVTN